MVYEKIKERKRLFPEKEKPRKPKIDKEDKGDEGDSEKEHIEMPEDRLVKACPNVKNPSLVFKDGKFMRA
jgi:hypothetical protein